MRVGVLVAVLCSSLLLGTAHAGKLKLKSSFGDGGELPVDNSGRGDNISPALSWSGTPSNTKTFVLIVTSQQGEKAAAGADGADKKTHWTIFDIPETVEELREELSSADGASEVGRLGMKDDAGTAPVIVDPMAGAMPGGYVDPEIQSMQNMIHGALDASFEDRNRAQEGSNSFGSSYYKGPTKKGTAITFKLYALNGRLELPRGAPRDQIVAAMKGMVLAKSSLTATVR